MEVKVVLKLLLFVKHIHDSCIQSHNKFSGGFFDLYSANYKRTAVTIYINKILCFRW